MLIVAIPSSSGHLFRLRVGWGLSAGGDMSQSLLHQVIYSVGKVICEEGNLYQVAIPSSSGHLFRRIGCRDATYVYPNVAIPSSSGHLFRL